jgi:cytoskeletal protein RodZ
MAVECAVRHNRQVFEIGASLREARIKRNLAPADVHKAIRIRDRYLQALEEERWELLPGDAYVKGFLRTYADFLGLDGNLYVDEYASRFAPSEEPALAPQPLPRSESGSRSVGLLRPLLAIGAIVAIVAAVAAWQLDGGSNKASPPGTTTTSQTTTGTTTTTPKKHHHPPVVLPTHATLIATRGACWVEIRVGSSTGKLVFENTLQQGQSETVSLASGTLWIDVGDPPNLDVHLGGKIAPGLPRQAGNVLLTQRGLKPA